MRENFEQLLTFSISKFSPVKSNVSLNVSPRINKSVPLQREAAAELSQVTTCGIPPTMLENLVKQADPSARSGKVEKKKLIVDALPPILLAVWPWAGANRMKKLAMDLEMLEIKGKEGLRCENY